MKYFILIYLSLIILFQPVLLSAQSSNYKQFQDAYFRNDHKKALQYIEKHFKERPLDENAIYWYGIELYYNNRFPEAIAVLLKLNPYYEDVPYYLASAYRENKEPQPALDLLIKCLLSKQVKQEKKQRLFSLLIELSIKSKKTESLEKIENEFLTYFKTASQTVFQRLCFDLTQFYFELAITTMKDETSTQTDSYFKKSLKYYPFISPANQKNFNRSTLEFFHKAYLYFKEARQEEKNRALQHRMYVLFIENNEALLKIQTGKIHRQKKSFALNEIEGTKETLEILRQLVFYLSKGRILPSFDYKITAASIKEMESFSIFNKHVFKNILNLLPDLNAIDNYPSFDLFSEYNNYDGYLFIYPLETTLSDNIDIFHSFIRELIIIPNTLLTRQKKMMMTFSPTVFSTQKNITQLLNCYIHSLNLLLGIPARLNWENLEKKNWPAWYHGEGELFYYSNFFDYLVPTTSLKLLNLKNSKEQIRQENFKDLFTKFNDVAFAKSQKAFRMLTEAENLVKKNSKKALKTLLEAYKLYPYLPDIEQKLGYLYLENKEYKNSLMHYEKSLKNHPDDTELFPTLAFLLEKINDPEKALFYYEKDYQTNKLTPFTLYRIGSLYYLRKDFKKAYLSFSEFMEKFPASELMPEVLQKILFILIEQEQNYPQAIKYLNDSFNQLKDKKDKAAACYYYAYANAALNKTRDASDWLKKALNSGLKPIKAELLRKKFNFK